MLLTIQIEVIVRTCKARSVIFAALEAQAQAFEKFGSELEFSEKNLFKREQELLRKMADFEPLTQATIAFVSLRFNDCSASSIGRRKWGL